MTKGLIKPSISQAKLLKKKLRNPTDHTINKYKTFFSVYNKLIRSSKATYLHEQLQLTKYNVKDLVYTEISNTSTQ